MIPQKAAIYCRLSIEDEKIQSGQESESIQNQKLLLTDYAQKQGWEIYDIYCDEDYSGLDENRPSYQKMLFHAQRGDFSILLCKTQSRLTRNMETAEHLLHHCFVLWGIRFVTIVDHVDTQNKGNKKARQINSLINEWYCEEISENIRAVFHKKMENGQFVGNYAPYGYLKQKDNRHHLTIHEPTAQIVRQIYQLYLNGFSCRKIAAYLTSQNIKTPWQEKYSRGEDMGRKNVQKPGIWAESTIRKILKNQVYIGNLVQGREKKLSYKHNKVVSLPESQWIIAYETHEPIISKEIFDQTQQKMRQKRSSKNTKLNQK